jgi:putative RNA 2'-phosphotransferase
MINEEETIRASKFLSLVLRHQPEVIGLVPDEQGWVEVSELLQKMRVKGVAIDFETLEQVVATNDKKRFAFNGDKSRIRASQGHSIQVDLGYRENEPPDVLYHGTDRENKEAIVKEGLKKGKRHHVHLSTDRETAIKVGQRHGPPFVFEVMAKEMHDEGYVFFVSENGVWLIESVPARFLKVVEE